MAMVLALLAIAPALAQVPPAGGADAELLDRPISAIRLEGLRRVPEQTVYNNIRTAIGAPYDPEVVRADVTRLNRLGQ
jgi:outer membrane protein assembly factor BamA